MNEENIKKSSVVDKSVQNITNDQPAAPTWFIIIFLIAALVILKSFIYIKDEKRHGK